MTIYFYGAHEKPYECFSNFSYYGFELDGYYWETSEHYFQAQKFVGSPYFHEVRLVKTPKEAALLGRKYQLPPLWRGEKRLEVMKRGVLRKFETHSHICDILLDTGNQDIIENAPKDYYWGCGADGTGLNMFGKTLMEVRTILRGR